MTTTPTSTRSGDLVDSLTPFETLPDWLAAAMTPDRVSAALSETVPELRGGGLRLVACTPERLRAKGDAWLARYRLLVGTPADETQEVILTGRLWPPSPEPSVSGRAVDEAAAEGAPAFGEAGWQCWLPRLRLVLQVEERDEALPALPVLTQPGPAAELIQRVLRQRGYAQATLTGCEPQVVRYKPGSRCTVVVPVTYAEPVGSPVPPDLVVLKTHQGDKGQTAWEAMNALWDVGSAWDDKVRLAEPLGFLAEERILVQGPVPEERTLKDLVREAVGEGTGEALAQLREELTRTAAALAAIHGSGAVYGGEATLRGELDEIEEVVERLSSTVPELEAAAAVFLHRQRELDGRWPADPLVPAHHDFRPAQVLLHRGRVGFIDFDGACMAEPALDIGRFRAKLRDIGMSALLQRDPDLLDRPGSGGELEVLDDLCAHFLSAYQGRARVSSARVRLWESADLFTAMLHAWTKVRLSRLTPRLALLRHQLRGNDG